MKFIITQNMIKNIKIKESQLQKLIYNILDNESFKKKKTIQEEIETIVDFHKRLYTSIFISQGNILEFESRKELYIKNIFSNNKKIIKEYYDKFNNNLLKESKNKPNIDKFFDFIKENLIEQSNFKLLNEAQNITSIGASIIKAIKGAGTDEEGVLKAIKQLKSKEEVYHLNNYIKSKTGENLKDYINNDMSDYDSEEYRAIWGHLGKFGFTGGNFSILLASIGKAAKAIGKGFQWLKENGLGWFMDKIRNFLDSGWGAAAQIFLDSFGIGAIGVVVVWGIMVVWDLINVNELGWGRLFFSCLSLLTAGAMSAVIGPLANLIKGFKGGFKDIIKKIFSSPLANSFKSWIPKITAGASKVAEWISKGVNWLLSKLSSYIPKNWVSTINGAVDKAVNWVKSLVDDINKLSSTPISKSVVTTIITKSGQKIPSLSSLLTNPKWVNVMKGLDGATAKIVDNYILKNAKNYTWEQIETGVCNQNKNACNPVKYLGDAYRLKTSSKQGVKDFATKVSDVSTRYGEKEQKT